MPIPIVKPITELRDTEVITELCKQGKPVIITRNGVTNFVIISESQYEEYENNKARLELYEKLAEAEAEAETGFEGHSFRDVAKELLSDLE